MFRYVRAALAAAALFLIAPLMNANPAPDKDGHVLTALWKQYEEASKADRPQKEAEILTKIKDEAVKQRLAADFYDAAVKYVESVQRRDWKKRDELRKNLEKEVNDFDEPMVTYLWMSDQAGTSSDARWAFVRDRSEAFRAGLLYDCFEQLFADGTFVPTDESGVVAHYRPDVPIRIVQGAPGNFKVTYPEDVLRINFE